VRQSEPDAFTELYQRVAAEYGAALERLAYAYEADSDRRRDLLQEIHFQLWRSFEKFESRCSLRTWIYRVAHNVATSHVARQRKNKAREFVTLEEIERRKANGEDIEVSTNRQKALTRLLTATPEAGGTSCIQYYRAELERKRDFHRGTWFWSRLLIFLPGPLLFCVGFAQAHPEIATFIWLEFAALLILAVIAVPLNLRLARKFQRRIDALNAVLEE